MRIAVIGQAAFGKSVVQSLCDAGEDIVGVYCPIDGESGQIDPIKEEALSRGIPVFQFKRMRDDAAIDSFLELDPDLCVMAFVTDFVPDSILQAPELGTIQYHPSLLPLHRGPSSINWPIINGEPKTGISIFWPDDGLDTGPILMQKTVLIGPDDTVGSLYYEKLYPLGVQAMTESVALIRQGLAPKNPQDHDLASYESWCGRKDGQINWENSGSEIYNRIRGCDPRPGASTRLGDKEIFLFDASFVDQVHDRPGGTLIGIDDGFDIAVNGGLIRIATVRFDGMRSSAGIWAKDHGMSIGDRLR